MQLNISQQMKQTMKLAPKMIQSMEILQMPLLALHEKVEQELADNVVLEREETENESDSANSDGDSQEATSKQKRSKNANWLSTKIRITSLTLNACSRCRLSGLKTTFPVRRVSRRTELRTRRIVSTT